MSLSLARSRHSGVKRKIKQSVVKWIEPNCAFKIINFHLSYPLYLFLFIIHFCVSLFYYFFYPRLLNVRTCVPWVLVATPLLPIRLKGTRRTCLSIRQTLLFRRAKLKQTPNISWTYSVQFGSSHEMFEAWPAWASVCLLLNKLSVWLVHATQLKANGTMPWHEHFVALFKADTWKKNTINKNGYKAYWKR